MANRGLIFNAISFFSFTWVYRPSISDLINGLLLWKYRAIEPIYTLRQSTVTVLDTIYFVKAWRTHPHPRKPFPGFNPGVYRQKLSLRPSVDPTLHFLRRGRPQGPWSRELIQTSFQNRPPEIKCALHIHVFYIDVFIDIMSRLETNISRPALYITVSPGVDKKSISDSVSGYSGSVHVIWLENNTGRDIGAFFVALPREFFLDFEVVGHVHTKKSIDYNDRETGYVWYRFMADNLLGSVLRWRSLDSVLRAFEQEGELGIVFPDDPNILGWSDNYDQALNLLPNLDLPKSGEVFDFPVGCFFFARPAALNQIFSLELSTREMPSEPLPYDGTILHALERLVGLVPNSGGFKSKVINHVGTTR